MACPEYTISLGCDPEFFFKRKRRVIGSEIVLPEEGFVVNHDRKHNGSGTYCVFDKPSKIIIDGVQAELNPVANTCRANMANEIALCFRRLEQRIKEVDPNIEPCFSRAVIISPTELGKLKEENQKFGCTPSLNAYGTASTLAEIDPLRYRVRAAGGHIHIGPRGYTAVDTLIKTDPDFLVQMLDVMVGNTCVLIDRDRGNIERRKLYGKAGEYRLPPHGLEYRTLSNFWLVAYPLMSFVFGMVRFAVSAAANKSIADDFMNAVSLDDITKAINTNNYDLAMSNFTKLIPVFQKHGTTATLNANNINQFVKFTSTVKENGLEHYFKEDPFKHWVNLPEAHNYGWKEFINGV